MPSSTLPAEVSQATEELLINPSISHTSSSGTTLGRTAKFGVWMQGSDYVRGMAPTRFLPDLAELQEIVTELRRALLMNGDIAILFPDCAEYAGIDSGTRLDATKPTCSSSSSMSFAGSRRRLLTSAMALLDPTSGSSFWAALRAGALSPPLWAVDVDGVVPFPGPGDA